MRSPRSAGPERHLDHGHGRVLPVELFLKVVRSDNLYLFTVLFRMRRVARSPGRRFRSRCQR